MKLPYRILALDDDESALEGIVELLRDMGYDVTPSTTYDDAKRLLANDAYDLLITDIHLRGFNGLHLIRQTYRDRPEMGLIIITGYEEKMMEVEAGRYGAEFVRMWRMYLAGSEASFVSGSVQLFQILFARGETNRVHWTRDWLTGGAST